jgi:hypothetical protein
MPELPFTFGIYAGSIAGTASGLATGPDDDPALIAAALDELHSPTQPLLIRAYLHYRGPGHCGSGADLYSQQFRALLGPGRKLDLVLCFHDPQGNLEGWLDCIRQAIAKYGNDIARLQITEEANMSFGTGAIDGDFPNVIQALAIGAVFAKKELRHQGFTAQVGFSTAPAFGPAVEFWAKLRTVAGPALAEAVDYAGLDFFPDVFRPAAPDGQPGDLRSSILFLLGQFRGQLTALGLPPETPIVITENGWPTGSTRPADRQTEVLEAIVRTVHAHREEFNIIGYEWFSLRDADSAQEDLFYQFGLLNSDYSRKPAFQKFRNLITELTTP